MSLFDSFKSIGDPLNMMGGGLLWKPIKKATGLTDAQMIGISAAALVGAPHVVPAITGSGAAGAGQAAGSAGGGSMTGGLFNFSGGQTAAPIVDLSTPASAQTASSIPAQSGGMLDAFSKYAGPASNVANIADKAGAFGGNQPQYPQAQFQQGQGFAGLLTPTDQVDPEKRRQAQQMAVQGLLGGYGRNYG